MTDYGLSSKQIAVICALSSGATMTDAAEQAGIHRNTIPNWRRNDLAFQYAIAHAQYDRALLFREKAEALIDLAVQTLQQILTDPKAPAGVRLKAALAVIELASKPPEGKKQVLLDIEKSKTVHNPEPQNLDARNLEPFPENLHKDAQSVRPPAVAPTPQNLHKDAQSTPPPEPQNVHNDAQPYRREHPKTGRNDTCPCGSGQKYKRCCLNKPLATAA